MKILDLFAGKGGEQRREYIEGRGHEYVTVDLDKRFNCSITTDIMLLNKLLPKYDFIWASPPCESFSVSSIHHHWHYINNVPVAKSVAAVHSVELVMHTLDIIKLNEPKAWLIENPRGMLRVMPFMKNIPRVTVTYCQYGNKYMKPTDLWGIAPGWLPRPACKNGDRCHIPAPRGSQTGIQGMKDAADKAIVPLKLWAEILDALEGKNNAQLFF